MGTCTNCRTEMTHATQTHCNFCGRPLAPDQASTQVETEKSAEIAKSETRKRRKSADD